MAFKDFEEVKRFLEEVEAEAQSGLSGDADDVTVVLFDDGANDVAFQTDADPASLEDAYEDFEATLEELDAAFAGEKSAAPSYDDEFEAVLEQEAQKSIELVRGSALEGFEDATVDATDQLVVEKVAEVLEILAEEEALREAEEEDEDEELASADVDDELEDVDEVDRDGDGIPDAEEPHGELPEDFEGDHEDAMELTAGGEEAEEENEEGEEGENNGENADEMEDVSDEMEDLSDEMEDLAGLDVEF